MGVLGLRTGCAWAGEMELDSEALVDRCAFQVSTVTQECLIAVVAGSLSTLWLQETIQVRASLVIMSSLVDSGGVIVPILPVSTWLLYGMVAPRHFISQRVPPVRMLAEGRRLFMAIVVLVIIIIP